jgi:ribosomal protein S24E
MEIKTETKNELMGRKELSLVLESSKNPNFVEVAKMLAEQFKTSEENIIVEGINGKFGRKNFLINASVYDTKELKDAALKRSIKVKKTVAPAA